MRYLEIQGIKKEIPPYPHHKDYVYRCTKFFSYQSPLKLLLIDGLKNAIHKFFLQWYYDCAIPYNILLDFTCKCNLQCQGCWSADYDQQHEMSYHRLDLLLSEAKSLGVNGVLFTGGEPLMRRSDLIGLCAKHKKLTFTVFTNGTLIDETFVENIERLGNLGVLLSIEGFEEKNDLRRGKGTFKKVLKAMELLRKRDIGFGYSVCYHALNFEEVCSDEFLDFMKQSGAWIGWFFNYMPLGVNTDSSLCLNATQRLYVKNKLDNYSKANGFSIIDFANMGHAAFGCVGGGNGFIHITANGDVEPCVFCHYSDANLNSLSLKDALRSPFFRHFRKSRPKNENPYQPCPIRDLPENLEKLLRLDGVCSTHIGHPEPPEGLAAKMTPIAKDWEAVADDLQSKMTKKEIKRFNRNKRYVVIKK